MTTMLRFKLQRPTWLFKAAKLNPERLLALKPGKIMIRIYLKP